LKLKVAVASSDGKVVNRHFGHTKQFLIFELSEGVFNFLESRENIPTCRAGRHEPSDLATTAEIIKDCAYVVASRIGSGAASLLLDKGIRAYVDADFIENTLQKLLKSGKLKYVLRRKEADLGNIG
jgi:predicted Fe-Mo cluster-binding NifX family protein